jgi:hypothetical protein
MNRKYQGIRLGAGDYLQASNDGQAVFRIMKRTERDWVRDDGSPIPPTTVWDVFRYDGPTHRDRDLRVIEFLADPDDWANWTHVDGGYRTKREAVGAAVSGLV